MNRPPMEVVMMQFADLLAERSTCSRRKVGAVVTDHAMLQVLGIGYNGNARGLPNECDFPDISGLCGCVHAETNALIKSPGTLQGKRLFCTCAPCLMCAKLILNAGITHVYYRSSYRTPAGIDVLRANGIHVATVTLLENVLDETPFRTEDQAVARARGNSE